MSDLHEAFNFMAMVCLVVAIAFLIVAVFQWRQHRKRVARQMQTIDMIEANWRYEMSKPIYTPPANNPAVGGIKMTQPNNNDVSKTEVLP